MVERRRYAHRGGERMPGAVAEYSSRRSPMPNASWPPFCICASSATAPSSPSCSRSAPHHRQCPARRAAPARSGRLHPGSGNHPLPHRRRPPRRLTTTRRRHNRIDTLIPYSHVRSRYALPSLPAERRSKRSAQSGQALGADAGRLCVCNSRIAFRRRCADSYRCSPSGSRGRIAVTTVGAPLSSTATMVK